MIPSIAIGCLVALHAVFGGAPGWFLESRLVTDGPFIVGESCQNVRIKVVLANVSGEPRSHLTFEDALKSGDLNVRLRYPDGRVVRRYFERTNPRNPRVSLRASESASVELALSDFGYRQLWEAGKYEAVLTLKTPQGVAFSLPWIVDVVEPALTDVFVSHKIGPDSRQKSETCPHALVQQIKLGKRVFLVYRSFDRGSRDALVPDRCIRLAELPGKVDLKVTGEYGRGKKLTIAFDDAKEPDGKRTIIVEQ